MSSCLAEDLVTHSTLVSCFVGACHGDTEILDLRIGYAVTKSIGRDRHSLVSSKTVTG